MTRLNFLDWLAFILVIIGAVFWGVVGILGAPFLNSLAALTSGTLLFFQIIWILVGLSGLWVVYTLYKLSVPMMREKPTA